MAFVRVYTGDDGKTHFEDLDSQPPEAEELLNRPNVTFSISRRTDGHFEDWHPSPARSYGMTLSGQVEIGVEDGTVRRFGPGDPILFDDATGKGHTTRIVGLRWYVTVRLPG